MSGTLDLVLTAGGYSNEFNCVRYHRCHGYYDCGSYSPRLP